MIRSCIVCRRRQPPRLLVRATAPGPGKGAWVCLREVCLTGLGRRDPALGGRAQVAADARLAAELERTRRSGGLVSGRADVVEALARGRLSAVILARDAGAGVRAVSEVARGRGLVVAMWTAEGAVLGRLLGRGRRSLIGVSAEGAGPRLTELLRHFQGLG